MSKSRLEVSIRNFLLPFLKEDGYGGSGLTFRRVRSEFIEVVNIQGSRYGGQFAINLGFHLLALPDTLGNHPDPKTIAEPLCELRRRLAESGSDQWWNHDGSQDGMDLAVIAASEVYTSIGRPLFARMEGMDFNTLSPENFVNGKYDLLGFHSSKVRMALMLARLRKAQNKPAESKTFAAYGLAHVGLATMLKEELELLSKDG